jgi:hypothetical protein
MNFYSSSVALLWGTAFRVIAPPIVSRQIGFRGGPRKSKVRLRIGGQTVAEGASVTKVSGD